jgi:hypothetical protein
MRGFLRDIGTLYWWLSVIAVGIAVNIISSYLKTKLDGQLSDVSSRWRIRSESQKAMRSEALATLRDSPHAQTMMATSIVEDEISSIYFSVWSVAGGWVIYLTQLREYSVVGMLLLQVLPGLVGAICVFFALQSRYDAMRKRGLLREARELDPNNAFDV